MILIPLLLGYIIAFGLVLVPLLNTIGGLATGALLFLGWFIVIGVGSAIEDDGVTV